MSKMMTNKEFVQKINDILALQTIYLHGAFGAPLTDKNKTRYCATDTINIKNKSKIYACSSNTFGFDCCGLIKAVAWGFSADKTRTYGGAVYKSNDFPDASADGIIKFCTNVSTDFTNIPEGAYVYMRGHCGVYVGGGYVVECTPKWDNGVQKSVCVNHPEDAKGNFRRWVSWGLLPFVDYTAQEEEEPEVEGIKPLKVIFNDGEGDWIQTIEKSMNIGSTNWGTLREIGKLCGYKVSWDKAQSMPRFDKVIK